MFLLHENVYTDKIILFALHRAIYIVNLTGCNLRAKNSQSKTIQASESYHVA